MSKNKTLRICFVALCAAMYVPMSMYLAVNIGTVRISFASLPTVMMALLFGPWEAVFTALIGEFLKQLLTYGITYTTMFYLIPPALRGLTIGLFTMLMMKQGKKPEQYRPALYLVCSLAATLTTIGNTLVNWLDSILFNYYSPVLIFGGMAYRFVIGIVTAIIVATVAIPIVKLLRKQEMMK